MGGTARRCEQCGNWMVAYVPRRRKYSGGPLLCDGCFHGRPGRSRTQAMLSRVAGADTDGVMVAIRPPENICEQLVDFSTEDYANLHITLAYLGSVDEVDRDLLVEIVSAWAKRTTGFDGRLSGFGRFEAGEEPVLYASADIPHLDEARALLVHELVDAGITVPDDHGFSPHLTLAYGGE